MTAAMFIAECLKQEGVSKVFGQCGHTNYALIDSCHRLGIEYVSFRHEQLAAHAADAYYRVSHKLAVVNVHLSPGMTNAITGVISAAADSTPMIVFCGNTPSYHHAREPHQGIRFHADASQGDLYRPFCKRVWRVDDAKFLADVMPRALNLAQTGRPGPVLIDVPMDVFSQQIDVQVDTVARRPEYGRVVAPRDGIAKAARLLTSATRPVVFAGNGVLLSDATRELRQLAELLSLPVATTLMGKGVFPERHPLALGMTGIWGTEIANTATRTADVVLAIGTSFGEADCSSWNPRFTFAIPPSRVIQIDIEPEEVGKIYPVEVGLVGDAKATLGELIDQLRTLGPIRDGRSRIAELAEERRAWEAQLKDSQQDSGRPIHPARLLHEISKVVPDDAIFVTDVGWNKNGVAQQFPINVPGTFITPSGLATMGFGPAAVLGVKMAHPERAAVSLVGDGGFSTNPSVIATAMEAELPVVWLVMDNAGFGTIAGLESMHYGWSYGCMFERCGKPYRADYAAMARACGANGVLIESANDLGPALREALASKLPTVIQAPMENAPTPTPGHWNINDIYRKGA
jgi:acetolactate synthase I/II/III large subunit